MLIDTNTLPTMSGSADHFVEIFGKYANASLWGARLIPKLSKPRLIEAHGSWQNDLSRVGEHEPKLTNGLDHFKQAGHLAFWIRRLSPLVEAIDPSQDPQDTHAELTGLELKFRELLLPYSNEYLAFDIGFQIVRFYEFARTDRPDGEAAKDVVLSHEYYETVCHFLKFKNVSPHALHLIYKSLYV